MIAVNVRLVVVEGEPGTRLGAWARQGALSEALALEPRLARRPP